jgi:hypothetical protein
LKNENENEKGVTMLLSPIMAATASVSGESVPAVGTLPSVKQTRFHSKRVSF